jgi:uncharacterized protein YjbJ (UPF0337 family)
MRHIALAIALTLSTAVVAPALAQTTTTTAPSPFWEKMKGSWSQTKGAVKEQWGKLTDDDLLEIEGRRDQLVGKIQTRYGITREEAERQVGNFERSHRM